MLQTGIVTTPYTHQVADAALAAGRPGVLIGIYTPIVTGPNLDPVPRDQQVPRPIYAYDHETIDRDCDQHVRWPVSCDADPEQRRARLHRELDRATARAGHGRGPDEVDAMFAEWRHRILSYNRFEGDRTDEESDAELTPINDLEDQIRASSPSLMRAGAVALMELYAAVSSKDSPLTPATLSTANCPEGWLAFHTLESLHAYLQGAVARCADDVIAARHVRLMEGPLHNDWQGVPFAQAAE